MSFKETCITKFVPKKERTRSFKYSYTKTMSHPNVKQSILNAHKYSSNHKTTLIKDKVCGCFYCLKIFSPTEITKWIQDSIDNTAICPYCGIDSIIGENSGYPITTEFLQAMKNHWF